jgi:hypothetical protein
MFLFFKRFCIVSAVFLTTTSGLSPAWADTVGEVVRQVGAVVAQRDGNTRALYIGAAVERGDTIVTYGDSKVAIRLADGGMLSLGNATEVEISEYVANGQQGIRGVLSLVIGIVRTSLGGPWADGFEVRSRAAVASMRSTDWITEATPDKAAVFVVEGIVEVTGRADAATVVLNAGDGTDVPVGGSPGAPKQWGQKRVDSVLARTSVP